MSQSRGRGLLLPVNLGTGESFLIRRRREGGSDSAAGRKARIMGYFPISLNLLPAPSEPTEAVSLLQQPHLMRPTKECDCAPMPVLVLHCNNPRSCWSLQPTAGTG